MHNLIRYALLSALMTGIASTGTAGDLKLTLGNGRATLIAEDAPVGQILAEWARIGSTTIVNAEKLAGPTLTLQLVDQPEGDVLELLLRSASGYIASRREVSMAGASIFDRVMILPTSRGPVGVPVTPPPSQFVRPMAPQMPGPVIEEQDSVDPNVGPNGPNGPNGPPVPGGPSPLPNVPAQSVPGQPQPVLTAPRPGILPAPPAGQPNPYGNPPPSIIRPPGGPGGPGDPR
jgi:hypothetical protein